MALLVPNKAFLQASPDIAMLFAPFRCTHPPPPVPPFLLMQNLSPKGHCQKWYNEAESLTKSYAVIGQERVKKYKDI